jgi:competence protein ComEA
VVEPIRPLPERRLVSLMIAFVRHVGPLRLAGAVGSVVVVVMVGTWLFRPAPAPIEASLPFAAPIATDLGATSPGESPDATRSDQAVASDPGSTGDAVPTASTIPPIVVHVAGGVVRPGLVRIDAGSRVADAVIAAGGPVPGADPDALNLAQVLVDGARIQVPLVGEAVQPVLIPAGGAVAGEGVGRGRGPLDLNSASAADLETLPGVGPATAAAILEHRTKIGAFRRVDDLLEVTGIGPAKLEALRDLVTV